MMLLKFPRTAHIEMIFPTRDARSLADTLGSASTLSICTRYFFNRGSLIMTTPWTPSLNIAFRGRNRVARLYLKIMYRAVYLDKIFKKSRCLLITDDIYIIILAWFAGSRRNWKKCFWLAFQSQSQTCIRPRIFYSRCSSALFYHIGNTCPIEKAIDGLEEKKSEKRARKRNGEKRKNEKK